MPRINGLPMFCLIAFSLITVILVETTMECAAASRAMVKSNSMAVYTGMSQTGRVVKYVRKGSEVLTDLELIGSDGVSWCNVLQEWDMTTTGYVKCEELERTEPEQREKWRALPSVEKPAPKEQSQVTPAKPDTPRPPAQATKSQEQPTVTQPPPTETRQPVGY